MTLKTSLTSVINKICQPDQRKTQDIVEYESALKKNKLFLLVFTLLILAHLIFMPIISLPADVSKIIFLCNIANLVAFLVLCRSYLTVFHIYFTIQIAMFPFISLRIAPDMAFMHFGNVIMHPALILMITNNIFLVVITGLAEIVASLTIFKQVIRQNLIMLDEDTFTEKLVETSVSVVVVLLIIFVIVFWRLNKMNKELAVTRKLAEDRLEQQKTFVFSFSHELRNPLNSLLGNLQLAMMSVLPKDSKETVRTAQMCAELLLQLINNVLDIGKCDLGRLEVNPTPTKVYECFERIWTISGDLISRKNLKSHIKIEKSVPSLLSLDSHRINQIMMNLIGNSLKFTEKGSIFLSVKWLPGSLVVNEKCFEPIPYDSESEGIFEKDEGLYLLSMNTQKQESSNHLVFTNSKSKESIKSLGTPSENPRDPSTGMLKIVVQDTGCGISQAGLSKLFQKFSQVSDDPCKRQIGTGLGLFITKEICRAMKGDIRAYSREGQGTTFIVCIPTRSVALQLHPHLQISSSSMISTIMQKKLKAVVADDSMLNIKMISEFFYQLNVEVMSTAANGLDAYTDYKNYRDFKQMIDIITLDIDMPKLDGKMACQKIREYERQMRLKPAIIILISGNYDLEQVNNYMDAHNEKRADWFLKKPVKFEDFSSTIYHLISKRDE